MFIETNLNGYQKKKYVCKLLYMYILGWDIEFGHLEAVNLIASTKYSEKQIVRSGDDGGWRMDMEGYELTSYKIRAILQ